MNNLMTLVIATTNPGKTAEIRDMLQNFPVNIKNLADFGPIPPVEEDGDTFDDNAYKKASVISKILGLPALADDSGLVVPVLNGEPGIFSARYAGQNAGASANIEKLLNEMGESTGEDRQAYFFCAIVLLESADDPAPLLATARWHGEILLTPRGHGGFGYDPVFGVGMSGVSAAELDAEEKYQVSHRGKALKKLLKLLHENDDGYG